MTGVEQKAAESFPVLNRKPLENRVATITEEGVVSYDVEPGLADGTGRDAKAILYWDHQKVMWLAKVEGHFLEGYSQGEQVFLPFSEGPFSLDIYAKVKLFQAHSMVWDERLEDLVKTSPSKLEELAKPFRETAPVKEKLIGKNHLRTHPDLGFYEILTSSKGETRGYPVSIKAALLNQLILSAYNNRTAEVSFPLNMFVGATGEDKDAPYTNHLSDYWHEYFKGTAVVQLELGESNSLKNFEIKLSGYHYRV